MKCFISLGVLSILPLFIQILFLTANVFCIPSPRRDSSSSSKYNIVSSNLCDDSVKQYSGYIQVSPSTHTFFWFFEARHNPETAPLTLWLTGGPGCSSLNGLFVEIGPCKTQNNGTSTITNPNSWTEVSNVIFLDQPIGVGFSYSDDVYNVTSSEQAAADMYTFLQLFFQRFPEYSKLDFHIFGESYGGRFDVSVNDTIVDQMNKAWPACEEATINCNEKKTTNYCLHAVDVCAGSNTSYASYFLNSGLSEYDIRAPAESMISTLSPDYVNYITKPDILQEIGANSKIQYLVCSSRVGLNLYPEMPLDFSSELEFLLENGIRTLIYHGDADWICNWKGGLETALNLNWKYKSEFSSADMKEWFVDGTSVGQVKCADILSFVKIYNAGHEAPSDQPRPALDMFTKWLSNIKLE
ncbi:12582_t:CDS:2 [Cetraspora pellucida]|uniref:Carboxypeptidase n=1 Tax=Cetraspora pellucida TaxID=1433469 RepID=A0A9N9EB34_9GLOM|nr:12582_t:CDS:2 [Cetraspora pellucida]